MQQLGSIVIGVGFQHPFGRGHWLGQQLLQVFDCFQNSSYVDTINIYDGFDIELVEGAKMVIKMNDVGFAGSDSETVINDLRKIN